MATYEIMYYDMELPQLLAYTYIKFGLTTDEFIVLNACILQSTGYSEEPNFSQIAKVTGKTINEIKEVLKSLYEKGKIRFDESWIDKDSLYFLIELLNQDMSTG